MKRKNQTVKKLDLVELGRVDLKILLKIIPLKISEGNNTNKITKILFFQSCSKSNSVC